MPSDHRTLRRKPTPHVLDQLPKHSMLPLWRRIYQEFMIRSQRWNLPPNVCMVLVHLHLHPEDSEPAALAEANYFPRQTVTFILDFLEKHELAVRKPHANDRRRKLIHLTAKGEALAKAMFKDLLHFETISLQAIQETDIDVLKSILNRYAEALAAQNDRDLEA